MDNFTYNYLKLESNGYTNNPTTFNRLSYVADAVPLTVNYEGDIEPEQPGQNYQYNKNGQLTKDLDEDIFEIQWTVTGKVKKITYTSAGKTAGKRDVKFIYDPMDRRIAKMVYTSIDNSRIDWTYYSYDAGGNVLATYTRNRFYVNTTGNVNNYWDNYLINDHLIYGAQRLGSEEENVGLFSEKYTQSYLLPKDVESALGWSQVFPPRGIVAPDYTKRVVGDKRYELSNHLGNVLEVISDRKVRFTDNGTLVYAADVISYSDYSPYGTLLHGRHGNDDTYRYGFNGMERDDEVKGSGNSYDFGARIYDPRVGRWLSADPLANKAPGLTPYRYGFNNPVRYFDPNGKWESDGHYWTVYLTARLLGIPDADAIMLATLAEGPDHIRQADGAWHSTSTWATPGLQQRWHALTGGDAGVEFLNTHVALMNIDVASESGFYEFGILLHRFGDVYAHRDLDNSNQMYGDNGYTLEHAEAHRHDGSKVGKTPDLIGNRVSDGTYMEYVEDMAFILASKFKTQIQEVDKTIFERMSNYALKNENKSLLGVIQFEVSKLDGENSLGENSFFVEYQHGHDIVTTALAMASINIYPVQEHVNNVFNAINYMVNVGGIKRENIRFIQVFENVEYTDVNGEKRSKEEYIGTKITYKP